MEEKDMRSIDIEDILKSADNAEIKNDDNGSLKFEFHDSGSLIFETLTKEESEIDTILKSEGKTELKITPSGEQNDASKAENDEFSLHDVFEVSDEQEKKSELTSPLYSTYVPRFTAASENYRMADGKARYTEPQRPMYTEPADRVDPTAELDGDAADAEVVNILGANTEETKTVYKFGAERKAPAEPKIRTVEDEIRDINSIMSKSYEPFAEPAMDDSEQLSMDISVSHEQAPVAPIFLSDEVVKEAQQPSYVPSLDNTALTGYTPPLPEKPTRREFSTPPQRDNFKDRFLDEILSSKVRLIVMAILTVGLMLVENFGVFGVNLYTLLHIPKYTGIPALLDLQFVICLFILACPELYVSLKKLLKKRVGTDLTLIASLLVFVLYDVIISVAKPIDTEYPLFAFIFGIHATAIVFASHLKKLADFENFKLITKNEEKKALTVTLTKNLTEENAALDGAVDSYKSKIAMTRRTVFIADFFKRSGKDGENSSEALVTAGISLAIALVSGVVAYFVQSGIVSFAVAFALTYLLSMPIFTVTVHKIPYHSLVKSSVKEGNALIGEASVIDGSDVDVIVYQDTEIFGEEDVNLRNFEGDMTKGLRQMSAIFSAVGGPLDAMFAGALDKKCSPATNITIEEDGIVGNVDGHTVMAGSEEFMLRHGAVFASGIKTAKPAAIATKVMYAADDGDVYASFNIRYSFSESFTMLFPTLKEEKTVPLIFTSDPNISNELVMALAVGSDTIRVLKKLDCNKDDAIDRKTSAGIVTVGDKNDLVNAVLNCKKYSSLCHRIGVSRIISAFVGAGLGALLSLGNMSSAPTVFFGIWQIGWCLAIAILAWREFAPKKEKGNENDL